MLRKQYRIVREWLNHKRYIKHNLEGLKREGFRMGQLAFTGSIGIWLAIFSAIMFTACLYFTLTYFEYLKQGDDRLIKQSKLFAVITLFLALGVPVFYQLYLLNQMMS